MKKVVDGDGLGRTFFADTDGARGDKALALDDSTHQAGNVMTLTDRFQESRKGIIGYQGWCGQDGGPSHSGLECQKNNQKAAKGMHHS